MNDPHDNAADDRYMLERTIQVTGNPCAACARSGCGACDEYPRCQELVRTSRYSPPEDDMLEKLDGKTKAEQFQIWARSMGATTEVTQEDDGSGYTVMKLDILPGFVGAEIDVTINE